jgi:hypothetical protein
MSTEDYISEDEYNALSDKDKADYVIAEKITSADYENEYVKRLKTPATSVKGGKKAKTDAAKHLSRRIYGQMTHMGHASKPHPNNNMRPHQPYAIGAGPKGKLPEAVEESTASETLRADSRSDDSNPKSKIEAINAVIGSMNSMSSDELTKWYTSAMALIGKEASALPGSANSDSNKSSLNMKGSAAIGSGGASAPDAMPRLDHKNNPLASMKEDVEEMFVGTDLSEEFKDKATTLFEAAVNARATLEIARLEEEFEIAYEERLEEEVASIVENVETNLDTYLDYIVENWMEDNQVAVESSLRNEIMEEFIGGLKGLFAEHYIDMPEEKVNVIEAMAQKIETLETALNESINDNNELKSELVEAKMLSLVDELSEGLTMSQAEKFAALAEGVSFDGNFNSYKSKLEMVKETYFSMKPRTSNIEEETFESDDESVNTVNMDPHVSNYVRAIARTTKK